MGTAPAPKDGTDRELKDLLVPEVDKVKNGAREEAEVRNVQRNHVLTDELMLINIQNLIK